MINLILIEDDPMVLSVNEGFVKAIDGFTVVEKSFSAQEGLTLVEKLCPDLLLLDVYLPDGNGLEVLQEIRRRDLPTDVIMITAAHDVDTIQQVLRYGAVDYIIKPFKFERLKKALEDYKNMKYQFNFSTKMAQEDLDRLRNQRPLNQEPLPKGLNEFTLKQVYLFLTKAKQWVSAEEVGEGIGLSRVTARRYLEHLTKEGQIQFEIQYGSIGRPIHKYCLLPK